jgi:hypothetical protein
VSLLVVSREFLAAMSGTWMAWLPTLLGHPVPFWALLSG